MLGVLLVVTVEVMGGFCFIGLLLTQSSSLCYSQRCFSKKHSIQTVVKKLSSSVMYDPADFCTHSILNRNNLSFLYLVFSAFSFNLLLQFNSLNKTFCLSCMIMTLLIYISLLVLLKCAFQIMESSFPTSIFC